MKRIANLIMSRRAKRLFQRIQQHLPEEGVVADIGSGTGHNAEILRQRTGLSVSEFDVADIHWVGPSPKLISTDTGQLPAADASCDSALLLFVLHYPPDPLALLTEVRRITRGPVAVLQSTYSGRVAHALLRIREFFFGRFGFYAARFAGLVSASKCPLAPSRFYTDAELLELFTAANFEVRLLQSESSLLVNIRRDLFILDPVFRSDGGTVS